MWWVLLSYSSQKIKTLLERYYEGLSSEEDWHSMLADNILLTGTIAKESRGKEAFVNNNFFKMIKDLEVKQIIAEEYKAAAVVCYDLLSPKGNRFSTEVAEIWKLEGGKLSALAIYFDTAAFQKAMA